MTREAEIMFFCTENFTIQVNNSYKLAQVLHSYYFNNIENIWYKSITEPNSIIVNKVIFVRYLINFVQQKIIKKRLLKIG